MATLEQTVTLSRSQARRKPARPWILIGLSVLVTGLMVLPLGYLLLRAAGAGADAWATLLRPRTLQVFGGSAALALTTAALSVLLAVPAAWLTVCSDLPLRRFWAVAAVLPLAVPSYIGGFAIIAMLGPTGMLQQALAPFGVTRLPEIYGFGGAVLALTLYTYPYVLLSTRAALRRCDPAVEEAARSMGDGSIKVFFRILLPQIRPSIVVGALLVALYSLSDFGVVSLLQFDSFTRAIYMQYRGSFDRNGAALLALLLVVLTIGLLLLESRLRGRQSMSRTTCAVARPRRLVALGWWRWPALAFLSILVGLGLGLPLLTLGYWLLRGLLNGQVIDTLWQPAVNSILAAGLAALFTLVCALPPALLAARHPGRLSRLIERALYIGYAIPGIVIALALVFFGANYAPWLYQTLPLLVVGYMVRFLPQAGGSIRNALQQMNPRVEEAARSLGRNPFTVLAEVTVPILTPGILAAAALVFLTTIKELPTTLLLGPTGFSTLATTIWSASSEAMFARAAAPALVLLLVSALAMAFMHIHDNDR
ncbi:MAG: iron ABC transporter permease [Oscillochloris sp.]|nr:iron ABC transporter permease [Oscillochloris sp.]